MTVKFLHHKGAYFAGDVATFDETTESDLVQQGYAQVHTLPVSIKKMVTKTEPPKTRGRPRKTKAEATASGAQPSAQPSAEG